MLQFRIELLLSLLSVYSLRKEEDAVPLAEASSDGSGILCR